MTWVPFNRQNRPTSNVHLCTTCVRTVDERKTSVTNPSSQGITLCGQKNPVDLPKQAVQSVLRTGKRTPTGTRGTVSESQGNPQGGPRGTEGPTGFTRWKRGRWRMILDPHRRTFTGEAVGRWRGRTGQPGRTNRWSSQGGRRPGNRTEELCGGITFEVVAPGNRGHGAGPKGVEEPGNRGGDTGRCGGSSRATGEAVERSGGRTGQPGRTKEKGIARRGASSDGRCHWSNGRLTPQDRSVVDHPLQESPRAARWLRPAARPGALRFFTPVGRETRQRCRRTHPRARNADGSGVLRARVRDMRHG